MSNANSPATINLPAPPRVGQATAVEQSRAVAEVHAAMVMARQYPRDINAAVAEMERSCRQMGLAARAFYRFPRSNQMVTGPSIHLARELARCWGNIQHGLHEMSRDDQHGQSEMQAFAWDVEKNTRIASTFIVPHARDAGRKVVPITELRDIYENNTNNGSRRVREAIFAVLPPWFVEHAKDLCTETIAGGKEGETLPQRIAAAVKAFAGGGITQDQLERKMAKPVTGWTEHDVAQLEVIFNSLRRGEVTKEEEFPSDQVTAAEITNPGKTQTAEPAPPQPESTPSETASPDLLRQMNMLMTECGITAHTGKGSTAANDAARFRWLTDFLGTPVEETTKNLTADQAEQAIGHLKQQQVERAKQRDAAERQIADLFDQLDTPPTGPQRLNALSRLLGRQIAGPKDITDAELHDIGLLLVDCKGQTSAWNAAVEAMEAQRQPGGQA